MYANINICLDFHAFSVVLCLCLLSSTALYPLTLFKVMLFKSYELLVFSHTYIFVRVVVYYTYVHAGVYDVLLRGLQMIVFYISFQQTNHLSVCQIKLTIPDNQNATCPKVLFTFACCLFLPCCFSARFPPFFYPSRPRLFPVKRYFVLEITAFRTQ